MRFPGGGAGGPGNPSPGERARRSVGEAGQAFDGA